MSEEPIEVLEEPTGIGSIIRVVFKGHEPRDVETLYHADGSIFCVRFKCPVDSDDETFYVGVAPGRWVEYGGDGEDEFAWEQMLQIITYSEAEVFEVVYEGFRATERNDASEHHIKDWIWREAL